MIGQASSRTDAILVFVAATQRHPVPHRPSADNPSRGNFRQMPNASVGPGAMHRRGEMQQQNRDRRRSGGVGIGRADAAMSAVLVYGAIIDEWTRRSWTMCVWEQRHQQQLLLLLLPVYYTTKTMLHGRRRWWWWCRWTDVALARTGTQLDIHGICKWLCWVRSVVSGVCVIWNVYIVAFVCGRRHAPRFVQTEQRLAVPNAAFGTQRIRDGYSRLYIYIYIYVGADDGPEAFSLCEFANVFVEENV